MSFGLGLVDVSTRSLETLLKAVHHGRTELPLTPIGLAALGLQEDANAILGHLRGLDATAVRAVLVAVIAERRNR